MKRPAGLALATLWLGSCAMPMVPEPDRVPALDLPEEVVANLPADIPLSEVTRAEDGCYFYVNATTIFTVRDASGAPLCQPLGA